MPQLGFKDGVKLSPKVKDYLLTKNQGDHFNNTKNILEQLAQIKQRQVDPEYLARQSNQDDYGLLPAYASAMAKLSSSFGTLGGQAADTSAVEEFGKALNSQQLANKAREKESLLAQEDYDQSRLALAGIQDKEISQANMLAERQANKEKQIAANKLASDLAMSKFITQSNLERERLDEQKRLNQERLDLSREQLSEQRRTNQERLAFNQQTALDRKNKIINEKRPTEGQFNAALYGKRMSAANDVINQLAQRGFDRTSYSSGIQGYLPAAIRSKDLKLQEQAERNFVNAILRRESGAAISPSEFDSASQQYFPRAGDSSEVLANKLQNREQAIEGLKAASATAWEQVPQVASTYKQPQPNNFGITETAVAAEKPIIKDDPVLSTLRARAASGDKVAIEYLKTLE